MRDVTPSLAECLKAKRQKEAYALIGHDLLSGNIFLLRVAIGPYGPSGIARISAQESTHLIPLSHFNFASIAMIYGPKMAMALAEYVGRYFPKHYTRLIRMKSVRVEKTYNDPPADRSVRVEKTYNDPPADRERGSATPVH
jgi:hypothetical protein